MPASMKLMTILVSNDCVTALMGIDLKTLQELLQNMK
ncbi:hypothetical protein HAPAU_36910 [Halalkalicoccus paucihalophilus]|uniref:Uncharacterized protein n=1 Tax=Halalkalicoccus paucihalophilus TaxID=1008153 RepID=A0A151A9I6_9EURY|nr:hypothetical protein HAPAU_36910 [Halalkalicoccus paucihalophilus]